MGGNYQTDNGELDHIDRNRGYAGAEGPGYTPQADPTFVSPPIGMRDKRSSQHQGSILRLQGLVGNRAVQRAIGSQLKPVQRGGPKIPKSLSMGIPMPTDMLWDMPKPMPMPMPMPYVNGPMPSAEGPLERPGIMIDSKGPTLAGSMIPESMGDEAGSAGGVVSGLQGLGSGFRFPSFGKLPWE